MIIQLITQHPESIFEIVKRTPTWVWGLFAALLALGLSQLRDQQPSLRRVTLVPIGMVVFGLYGLWSAFGSSPQIAAVMLAWLAATLTVSGAMLFLPVRSKARFEATKAQFWVPGSAVPLVLILGIFMTKYLAGVELGMNPAIARDASFALPISLLYGAFNGLFAARALRLIRLARITTPISAPHRAGAHLIAQGA
jgi:hypothetical protein